MPTLVIAPLINPTDNFRPVENFSQIAYIGGPPVAFVASSSSELKSFDALLRIASERPLNYGTGGVGTVGHLTAAYVAHKANLKLTHIPYNGPMIGDIISGVVDFGSLTASTVLGNIDGGTLRGLAIGTDKRLPTHPEIPTFKELGFDLSPIAWLAMTGPPGMPRELQITLNKEITDILERPRVKDILKQRNDRTSRNVASRADCFHQKWKSQPGHRINGGRSAQMMRLHYRSTAAHTHPVRPSMAAISIFNHSKSRNSQSFRLREG